MTAHSSAGACVLGYGAVSQHRGSAADAGQASSRARKGVVACLLTTSVAIATMAFVSTPPSGVTGDLAIPSMILPTQVEPSVLLLESAPGAFCPACPPRLLRSSVRARGIGAYVARQSRPDTCRAHCRLSRARESNEQGKLGARSAKRCARSALTPTNLPACPFIITHPFLKWLWIAAHVTALESAPAPKLTAFPHWRYNLFDPKPLYPHHRYWPEALAALATRPWACVLPWQKTAGLCELTVDLYAAGGPRKS